MTKLQGDLLLHLEYLMCPYCEHPTCSNTSSMFEVGIKIKLGLTATIYQKFWDLSNQERGGKTTGDIVNFISVDTSSDLKI